MIWFKHYCDAHLDEKLRKVMAIYDHWGHSVWWLIVAEVASTMKGGSNKCDAEMSVSDWCKATKTRSKKFMEFIKFLESDKIKLVETSQLLRSCSSDAWHLRNNRSATAKQLLNIRIPKLLELRDSRNQVRQPVGTIDKEEEVEEDKKKSIKEKVVVGGDERKPKKAKPKDPKKPWAFNKNIRIPDELAEMDEIPADFKDILDGCVATAAYMTKKHYADKYWIEFCDYWVNAPDVAKSKKRDWYKTFRNGIALKEKFNPGFWEIGSTLEKRNG